MSVIQIKDDIFWVGVMDPELEVFDIIMKTEYGTSYNSYLVRGEEKIALIDSVKEEFFEEYLAQLAQVVNLEEIDYLIVNHTEPDHAGSIAKLLDLIPGLIIVGHANAVEFLREVCNRDFAYQMISNRSEIDLGGKTLHFINALSLHWPDTMYTYVKEDKVLFSCDSFGSHYPDQRLFNDLIDKDLTAELRDYFEHILGPFKAPMRNALNRLEKYDIDIICPGHGPVWRQNPDYYINLYRKWSAETTVADTRPTVILAWISAHGYTEHLARSIEQGLTTTGALNVKVYDLLNADMNTLAREIQTASGLLIGTPTINKDAPPQVWDLLTRLSPLIHGGKVAAAFGAYGWSGEAVPIIESRLRTLRMKIMPGLRVRMKPTVSDLEQAVDFGKRFARAVLGEDDLLEGNLKFQAAVNPNNSHDFKAENYKRIYQNSDIMVYWNPEQCTHDTNCFSTLPTVFNPSARPWVNIDGDDPVAIIKTVDGCPSGALRYSLPEGSTVNPDLARGPGWIHYYDNKERK
ncbi:MAG TPA: MBL fold metallo-hydrolase [Syntrophomonadaceae bacterium]|nr:MBL fold metallo-hydrolase [Syntrophomonadaceae bacterium]